MVNDPASVGLPSLSSSLSTTPSFNMANSTPATNISATPADPITPKLITGTPGAPNLQTAPAPISPVTKTPPASFASASGGQSTASVTLPNGGTAATDQYGNVISPTSFSLDTSGSVPSSVLGSNVTASDVNGQGNAYAQYVQGLAQAKQLPQSYIDALNAYNASTLKTQSDQVAGTNMSGVSTDFAQGLTARQLQTDQLGTIGASNALTAEQAKYTANVDAATGLASAYAPTSVSPGSSLVSPITGQESYSGLGGYQAVQGISTVQGLISSFPDAGIVPGDTPQIAAQKAMSAPSFQARNLIGVPLPGGGYSFVNKNQLRTNPDGSYTYVSPTQASNTQAASDALKTLTDQKSQMTAAISTADSTFPLLLAAAKKAGLNNNSPLINGIQQAVANRVLGSGDIAALNTLVTSVSQEYSRIIARGGTVDDSTRTAAGAIVNGTYSLDQLQTVYDTVKKESAAVLSGYDTAIKQQQDTLNSFSSGSGSSTGGSTVTGGNVGDSWANI